MPSKIKKNFNIIQHTLIDQQIADLRAQLPKKSNKNLKTILLYHGLHFSLLGCKTTTRKRTRSCILCYIQHPRDQLYYAIMSVHVHYLRKIQINGLGFDSVFLCGTFGMSIMAKYTWLNKIQLTALVNCSGNPKMISYMSTKSFFFCLTSNLNRLHSIF